MTRCTEPTYGLNSISGLHTKLPMGVEHTSGDKHLATSKKTCLSVHNYIITLQAQVC